MACSATSAPHSRSSPDGVRPGPSPSRSTGACSCVDPDRRTLAHRRIRMTRGCAMRSKAEAGSPGDPSTMRARPSAGACSSARRARSSRAAATRSTPATRGQEGGRHIEAAAVLTTASRISIVPASMRTSLPAGGNFRATRAQPAASTVALSGPLPMLASPMQRRSPSASRCKLRANTATNTADAWRSTKRSAWEPQHATSALAGRSGATTHRGGKLFVALIAAARTGGQWSLPRRWTALPARRHR